jgi:hypothetical protein
LTSSSKKAVTLFQKFNNGLVIGLAREKSEMKFEQIPKNEVQHFIECEQCHEYFDCRDLSQVLQHTHQPVKTTDSFIARKISEPIEYLNGKVRLNSN